MPTSKPLLSRVLHSPVQILAIIVTLVFCTEVVVMLVLSYLLPNVLNDTGEAFLDGFLLTLVCSPVLWAVITAAKRAEGERLLLARETEALRAQQMATLAQLATGVAHEIRNPLTSIKMLVQVNRAKFAEEGLPTADLDLVEHEIRRMERSINSLLEYARPDEAEFAVFSMQDVVQRTRQLIEGQRSAQGIGLELDIEEAPIHVCGDAAHIQQLLLNLALNAIDAMPQGGTLSIRVERSADQCQVVVADTGAGIDPAVQEKLFSPFVTTKPNGVGLGLGICRRIAESHRGSLTGKNRATGGAEFRITLPLASQPTGSSRQNVIRESGISADSDVTCRVS
ncbi:MAG: ATP-binding protein [Planctomycetaceae bacterium]